MGFLLATGGLPAHLATADIRVAVRGNMACTFAVIHCIDAAVAGVTPAKRGLFAPHLPLGAGPNPPRLLWYAPCTAPCELSHRVRQPRANSSESVMRLRPATVILVASVAGLFGIAGAANRRCGSARAEVSSLPTAPPRERVSGWSRFLPGSEREALSDGVSPSFSGYSAYFDAVCQTAPRHALTSSSLRRFPPPMSRPSICCSALHAPVRSQARPRPAGSATPQITASGVATSLDLLEVGASGAYNIKFRGHRA